MKSVGWLLVVSLQKLKKCQQESTKIYESFSRNKHKELSYNEQQIHKFDRLVCAFLLSLSRPFMPSVMQSVTWMGRLHHGVRSDPDLSLRSGSGSILWVTLDVTKKFTNFSELLFCSFSSSSVQGGSRFYKVV